MEDGGRGGWRSASLVHRLGIAVAEIDVQISLVYSVGLNTGFNRELPDIERATYVDLGDDAAAFALEAPFTPVEI